MPLFGKKNKKSAESEELEVTDKTENDKADINVKSKNPFARIKKKARVIFKLRLKRKNSDEPESEADSVPGFDSGDDGDDEKEKKGKKKKPKKEKKEKPKKEKKPKKKKAPKTKSSEGGEGEKNGKRKVKPIIWIIIAVGALAVGTAAFLVANFIINKPSVEEQLINAQLLFNEQKYAEANEIYAALLKDDETLVPAHIGSADVLNATEGADAAINKLTEALTLTDNSPIIQEKIDELNASKAEAENGAESSVAEPVPTVVTFSDPMFEKMIRLALQKADSEKITDIELSRITSLKILGNTHAAASISGDPDAANNSLSSINRIDSYTIGGVAYTERGTIVNLNDLKYFTGLKKVVVAYNSVTDISGISELKDLNTVGLYCNEIADITPLSKLESLEYLYLYSNRISDLTPLAPLTKMRQLWLNNNNITDISALKGFGQLSELFLPDNEVSDISAVSGMKSLIVLHFADNQVSDISAIKDLPSLIEISFINNPVSDTSPASQIKRVNRP